MIYVNHLRQGTSLPNKRKWVGLWHPSLCAIKCTGALVKQLQFSIYALCRSKYLYYMHLHILKIHQIDISQNGKKKLGHVKHKQLSHVFGHHISSFLFWKLSPVVVFFIHQKSTFKRDCFPFIFWQSMHKFSAYCMCFLC